jgi:hypothetical protein
MIFRLFDDAALDAHIKKLQGAIKAPPTPPRRRKSQELKLHLGIAAGGSAIALLDLS